MRRDLAILDVAQLVRERLGHDLNPRLRDVVGRVARRTGDPLLRAGVDDRRRRPLLDHRRGERVHPVDDAPEVDVDEPAPPGEVAEHPAPAADARVVHEQRDLAERLAGEVPQGFDGLEVADVDDAEAHVLLLGRRLRDPRVSGLERRGVGVRENDFHARPREALRRREADAAGGAGDHRDAAGLKSGMKGHLRGSFSSER